jgi:hypothetical protein
MSMQLFVELHDTLKPPELGKGDGDRIDQLMPFQRSATDPTAMQATRDEHDTLNRPNEVGTFGVCWIDQRVPFHRSTRMPRSPYPPTATQTFLAGQDTLFSPLDVAPTGVGMASTDHFLPFHRSASGCSLLPPKPTAVQAVADEHDTALSTLFAVKAWVAWTDHRLSVQRSAKTPRLEFPTAKQTVVDGHDTPYR